jgi:hypothetical protein
MSRDGGSETGIVVMMVLLVLLVLLLVAGSWGTGIEMGVGGIACLCCCCCSWEGDETRGMNGTPGKSMDERRERWRWGGGAACSAEKCMDVGWCSGRVDECDLFRVRARCCG